MSRRWIAVLVAALAALLLAPVVLLLAGRPVGQPDASPSASAPAASAAETMRPSSGAAAIPFTPPTSPEDAAWYQISQDPFAFPQRLEIGTMGGEVTFDVEHDWAFGAVPGAVIPGRPVAGIVDGVVVIVLDDGSHSVLRAVVAATGATVNLVEEADVILEASVNSVRREVVFVTADRLTGNLKGGWVLPLDPLEPPRQLEGLTATREGIRLAAVAPFATWLMVSPDGSAIGAFRCVGLECHLRVVRAADGELLGDHPIDRGWREPFAVTAELALLRPVVPDGPERFGEVLDLATGNLMPLGIDPWPSVSETVGRDAAGDYLAIQTAGASVPPALLGQPLAEQPEITLLGLPGLEPRKVLTWGLDSVRVLPSSDGTMGVDLPPGWILAEVSRPGEQNMTVVALSTVDGSLIPLFDLGEVLIQG